MKQMMGSQLDKVKGIDSFQSMKIDLIWFVIVSKFFRRRVLFSIDRKGKSVKARDRFASSVEKRIREFI